jgi:aminoglycoside phosphotransferase (APT) family kinase protein
MIVTNRTPARSSRTQQRPADPHALNNLLRELDIRPPGETRYKLVSKWAAKHVWRVDVNGEPWAYIRYLLGPASQYPDQWRHLKLGTLLHEARVGPRVMGMSPESSALGGRAAIVEAALKPISREELEARADEAVALFGRLHTNAPLLEALSQEVTATDRERFSPLAKLFGETQERWFQAVTERWLEAGLPQISEATQIVSELLARIEIIDEHAERIDLVVPAHNDPNHGNFMVNRQGALRMIDFEELALSNPVSDLGIFLTWYVDRDRHHEVLSAYPLADPDAILSRMRIWVPLRYIGIAAHWAARLPRARDAAAWNFAAQSILQWLRGACELVSDGSVPPEMEQLLHHLQSSLVR